MTESGSAAGVQGAEVTTGEADVLSHRGKREAPPVPLAVELLRPRRAARIMSAEGVDKEGLCA